MTFMTRALGIVDTVLERFLQTLLVLVTLVVIWQVFSRYVLNAPSSFTEELARFLLIWITLLGCVYAYRKNSHLGLDMIYAQTNKLYKKWIYRFIHICIALFAICVMIIGGFLLMNMTEQLGQSSPVMGIDISAVYSVIPISGILILLYCIQSLVDDNYEIDTPIEDTQDAIVTSDSANKKEGSL